MAKPKDAETDVAVAEIVGRRQHLADHLAELSALARSKTSGRIEGEFVAVMTRDDGAIGMQAFRRCAT